LADKFDNLIGCFLADLKPTSSSDPYALRRQILGVIKMLIAEKQRLHLRKVLKAFVAHFPAHLRKNEEQVLNEIEGFITNRVKTVFLDYEFRKDEIEAALSSGFTDIYDAFCKVNALREFRESSDKFPLLYEVYKRAKGQLEGQKALEFSSTLLIEPAEIALDSTLNTIESLFQEAINNHQYEKAYELVSTLQSPLAALFEKVKILADDPKVRSNRIALLQRVFNLFSKLLDFSKIQEKE
jgi:glycyl-tRNA synthetase